MQLSHFTLLSLLTLAQPALAVLNINVSGVIGSNTTIWEFSGSYETANNFDFTLDDSSNFALASTLINQFDGNTQETGGLDFTEVHNFEVFSPGTFVSGSLLGSESGSFQALGLLFDDDDGQFADDFAWTLGNGETLQFAPRETITFTNYIVEHTGFDISDFDQDAPGASILQNGDFFSTTSNDLGGLNLNFTAVPEPSSLVLLTGGLVSLTAFRSRRKSR